MTTYTKKDLLLGGPRLDSYAYRAAVYCIACGEDIIRMNPADTFDALTVGDSESIPVPIFFGESEHAQHCDKCGVQCYGGNMS